MWVVKYLTKMHIMKDKYIKILVLTLLLILWEVSSRILNSNIILPSIKDTLEQIIIIINSKDFYIVILSSIIRCISGFIIAIFLGLVAGIVSYLNKFMKEVFHFVSKLCASIPTVAIILLILIWFKSSTVSMLIGLIMVFPIIYNSVYSSIKDYDKAIVDMMDIYKVPLTKRFKKVYIPKIFQDIKKISASSFAINFKMVIAGEVISQPKYAIGTRLYFEKVSINTSGVFAWIIIILCLIAIINYMLSLILRK